MSRNLMTVTRAVVTLVAALVLSAVASSALAQAPAPAPAEPPKPWSGSLSAGIALTSGNTDTTTTNLAFDITSDRTKRNVIKAEGLNLRSSRDGESIVDRTVFSGRDEYGLTTRSYVFGQFQYLRDVFKAVDYLMSPGVGIGYKVIDTMPTTLTVDVAGGVVIERDTGFDTTTNAALTANQKLLHKLSTVAAVTESFNALWKTSDFGDALYTFKAGIAADLTRHIQLKVDFLNTYKTRPPTVLIQKNDIAFLTSFGFKF